MSFKAIDNKLLKKYTKIWKRVRHLLNIEFDGEPIYGDNDKKIKTKIKVYGDKVNTNFQGKKITKENTACKFLSSIMLDSVVRVNKKYYTLTLLGEGKHEIKKAKKENLINDELEPSSSDESDNESNNKSKKPSKKSDNETDNEQFLNKSQNEDCILITIKA